MRIASSRSLVTLALVLSLGVGALFARAILTIRDDQWAYARHINSTLAHTIEQNIARTVTGWIVIADDVEPSQGRREQDGREMCC